MIYDKKITNNRQFKSCQSALEFSDSLPPHTIKFIVSKTKFIHDLVYFSTNFFFVNLIIRNRCFDRIFEVQSPQSNNTGLIAF